MRKKTFYKIFLTALLVLLPLLSSSADAALGDFLYKWGKVYSFYNPRGIAVDSSGNVYVANSGMYKIEVFDSTGTFLRAWGSNGSGDGQFLFPVGIAVDSSGNVYVIDLYKRNVQVFSNTGTFLRKWGSQGSGDGQFYNPSGIAVDSSGNVYVVEDHTHRVQVFSSSGIFLRKWGSQGGGEGQFRYPNAIAVDSSGNVYVADTGNDRVQVFSNTGTFLRKWGTPGTGDGQFTEPVSITVDSNGNVFVIDFDSYGTNDRVQVFTNTGIFLRKWGSFGNGDGKFMAPWAIAVNPSGNVYVLDFSNYTPINVQIFDSTGTFLAKWTNDGTGDGQFKNPGCMAVDSSGNVYVADTQNNRVQVFNNTGSFLRKWGSQFNFPAGIAVGGSGNVYVTDYINHRIQVFSNTGVFLRKWGTYGSGDGQLNYPWGIAVDENENVYVVNGYKQHVQVFSSTGTFLRKFGSPGSGNGQFSKPSGIALDTSGNVYVVDYYNANVQVFSNAGAFLRKWGSYGSSDGQFSNPRGVAVDSSGNVYVADTYNHRIQAFGNTGTFLGKWGAFGSGDGQLKYPWGMAVDGSGNVIVADFHNNRVQVFEGILTCALTADAGPDQIVEQMSPAGASVALNGTSTAQGCTGVVAYEWTWPGGSATGANPSVLMPPGTTNITLMVRNGTQTAMDDVVVAVRDTQAPSTTSIVSGIPGVNGWHVSDVAVALNASDTGSGVREIHYSVDVTDTVVAGDYASMTLSTEGTYTLMYFAIDNATNWETAHPMTINIDKTPPTITATVTPAPNANGWNNTDVTVTFTCSDTGSGIAFCPAPVTVTAEEPNQKVIGTAADKAGNTATASITLNIDKTPPAITITGINNGATYVVGAVPSAGYSVIDNLSGMASQNASLAGGNSSGVGTYTYAVTASDLARNTASAAASYSAVYNFSGFLAPVSLGKPFKLRSTIPVKFQLTSSSGSYISTANATMMIQKYSDAQPVGDPLEVTSTSGADTGNLFRYSMEDNLYIYNLSTDGLSEGTWQIRATLDDGTVKTAFIFLKVN